MSPMTIGDRLVSDLAFGRIRSVAFVVSSDVTTAEPLYALALATARRGWSLGIDDVRYWFVTPEPASSPAGELLESEGITFIGSTYADVRGGLVRLDPQGESIVADCIVGVGSSHEPRRHRPPAHPVRPAAVAA